MIFLIIAVVVILFQVILIGVNQRRNHKEILQILSALETRKLQ